MRRTLVLMLIAGFAMMAMPMVALVPPAGAQVATPAASDSEEGQEPVCGP